MDLQEFEILITGGQADAWSDALLAAGAVSVSIEDADGGTPAESARYAEPGLERGDEARGPGWDSNRLCVLVDAGEDPCGLVARAAASMGEGAPQIRDRRTVAERDWVRQTQSQFPPMQFGRIWIVPSWHEPPDPSALNLRLDPGAAFGTGSHASTRLCLLWLQEALGPRMSVLDFGCGSGILSIAAARLGAGRVEGVDIDPAAIHAARANAARNHARVHYTLAAATAGPARTDTRYDLVVANILANPLMLLAPALCARLSPGGAIFLSGILERQAQDVVRTYAAHGPWSSIGVWRADEGWVGISARRAAD
jgi:ribosomal protein L11 methyltransferase